MRSAAARLLVAVPSTTGLIRMCRSLLGAGVALALASASATCFFPTQQTASVRRGFHVTAGAGVLSDQTRLVGRKSRKSQGHDYILFASPSVGFGRAFGVELGLPLVVYGEDLTGSSEGCVTEPCWGWERPEDETHFFILPYLKVGFAQERPDKVAAVVGLGGVAVIYSHDLGQWEPYGSVKRIFSGGDPQVADVPRIISRFQESEQSIWALAAGVERHGRASLGLEVGLLANSYRGSETLFDLFVGARVTR